MNCKVETIISEIQKMGCASISEIKDSITAERKKVSKERYAELKHFLSVVRNPSFDDDSLREKGYEKCDFGDSCEDCKKDTPKKDFFFIGTSYEYPNEGEYRCRKCASKSIVNSEIETIAFDVWAESHVNPDGTIRVTD